MGLCEQIYDHEVNGIDFVVDLYHIHGRYKLSEQELNRLRFREMAVHGIPIEVLARGNLFQNSDMA